MNKIIWLFKRHPFLYYTRFKLLSKAATLDQIVKDSYNSANKKEDIPKLFYETNTKIFDGIKAMSDLDKAMHISIWLNENIKGGSGLSLSSEKALKTMLDGKGSVRSDMAQIFNNFCVVNDIKVKEWGITVKPFDKTFGGHSINEVYCPKLDKWVLLDVSNGLLFYQRESSLPLSVIEFFKIKQHKTKIVFKYILKQQNSNNSLIERNFFNKNAVPFLISNYKNKTYDNYLNTLRPILPVFVIHFLLFLFNKSYCYKFVTSYQY